MAQQQKPKPAATKGRNPDRRNGKAPKKNPKTTGGKSNKKTWEQRKAERAERRQAEGKRENFLHQQELAAERARQEQAAYAERQEQEKKKRERQADAKAKQVTRDKTARERAAALEKMKTALVDGDLHGARAAHAHYERLKTGRG